MKGRTFAITVLATSLLAPAVPAQPPGSTTDGELAFSGSASVSWVLVPVVARRGGHRQKAFRKLEADDFRLFVDDQPVPVASFEAGFDNPIRLVFLQDLSGSMANSGKLDISRQALNLFLDDARPGDETALATFTAGEAEVTVPFTNERQRLLHAAEGWRAWGRTALHDAVAFLPTIRASDQALRRAAILLTDGGDNASELTATDAREAVRAAELPVYVLDLRLGRPPTEPQPFETSVSQILELLAHLTGGRYFAITDEKALLAAQTTIADELREQYVLGFQTRSTGTAAHHKISLEIAGRRKARLSHRHGYIGLLPHDGSGLLPHDP